MPSGGSNKSETQTDPWSGIQPYLQAGYSGASNAVLGRPKKFFPGQTYVDYSPESQQALAGITERATAGSPLTAAAQEGGLGMLQAPGTDLLTQTASGAYTGAENPYMDALSQSIAGRVIPQVQSSFGAAGRTGSSPIAQGIMAREMTNALAPYQFQDYGRERGLQESAASQLSSNELAAMGMTPQLAGMDYADLVRLGQVGSAQEAKSGEQLADEMARFQFGQNEPGNRVAQYMQLLSGSAPLLGGAGSSSIRQPSQTNPIFGLLGTAMTAAPFLL